MDIDIRDIIQCDSLCSAEFKNMIIKEYVRQHHNRKISYLENRKCFRTFVGNPRVEVKRKTEEDMYEYLYTYYKEAEKANSTVSEVFERFLERELNVKNKSQNTINRNRQIFNRFYKEPFASRQLSSISDDDISEYINSRSLELTPTTRALNDAIKLLFNVFEYGMCKEKLILDNPVKYVDVEDYYKNCKTTAKNSDEKTFSEEELQRIEEAAMDMIEKRGYDGYALAILFAINTGVRAGEIPPLRWEDITGNGIHIHRQQRITRNEADSSRIVEELPYTKNERIHQKGGRFFPVTDRIQEIIDTSRFLQEKHGINTEFIFCNNDGTWLNKETYETRFRRLCKRLGFKVSNNHALRMSLNSSVFVNAGFSTTEAASLLGHSPETNARFYSHMRSDNIENLKNRLNSSKAHTGTHF